VLQSSGGSLAAIYSLNNDQWSPPLIQRVNSAPDGTDFTLQPGVGYLLYTDQGGSYLQSGMVPVAQPSWTLNAGWNLVGVTVGATSPISASTVLQGVLQQSNGSLAAIYALSNGQWSAPVVLRAGTSPNGTDFPLLPGLGYLLYTDMGTSYTPGAASAGRSRLQTGRLGAAPIPASPQQPPPPGLPSP
jgi:hypothetical protein